MTRNWKLLIILATTAVVGATAIAFASDLISLKISAVSRLGVMSLADEGADACPPNACSVVTKSDGNGKPSQIFSVH